jgi:polyhydroxyalkanoate synthase
MAAAPRSDHPHAAVAEEHPALDAILGANPFVGIDAAQMAAVLARVAAHLAGNPRALASRMGRLSLELAQVAAGLSDLEPHPSDKRFTDPAWQEHPLYRRLMQSYLAWRTAMHELVDDGEFGDWKDAGQARFVITLLTEAFAPTNQLATNPAAIKRAFDTAGMSVLAGLRNFVVDLFTNGGMPQQVDKRPFELGRNIAVSPGTVVFRNPLCEVIQYRPFTERVFARPLLLIPPQINKFYVMDLAPGRSFIEYAVKRGIQVFTISWRNPTPANREWGIDDYVSACKDAINAACLIASSRDCNVVGVCAGGITASLLLGHLTASGDTRVNAMTLLVTMLDTQAQSTVGMFATEDAIRAAIRRSKKKGVLDGADMARIFAWMRPNDLVWNYWVNNYLMGRQPPPFDILFWNSDSTCLPARLHEDFLDLFLRNPLIHGRELSILGTPINLKQARNDLYLVAGMTDHICAWRACYRATRMFGGKSLFVLGSSGHIQSLVNPPGNPKSRYFINPRLPLDPDAWLKGATEHEDSWWDHWLGWLIARSGKERPAPAALGGNGFEATDPAPGLYVHERH